MHFLQCNQQTTFKKTIIKLQNLNAIKCLQNIAYLLISDAIITVEEYFNQKIHESV